ncbi:MAG: type 1 glutamine amidotransferase [Achromobacter sp.]|jgi:protease I|uniref:Protein/nucleic acid deglycase 2 n=1 Tax=Achromobacter insuavis TaxID=1287735 RepID=A0A6J5IL87_9BURK|nr:MULTISPECIES: type 1 glutamine amidotransferase domain-containing protein [Achromobacter]MBN9638607.1 type 1 glutamine amidotransferase [Achromobacter sp.]CAB3718347.1 Protein/nucleic acid deglycase 2 [Achromobacter insuavis]CAB3924679.1 Protein/nucleic acid deglycase 2 [Achromobacter insuavis]CUJ43957.1 hydroperoxidase II [Achromobacter sp. 2789STDY5608628]CUJ58785.1 hydroperoxidase II [Achromobacter sp. 2789STDY5608621]
MTHSLQDFNVAILVTDGFEQVELTDPRDALQQQGARTVVVSARRGPVQGMRHNDKGDRVEADLTFAEANPASFDAVLLPGGVINADEIRLHSQARAFVQAMHEAGKPLAVICHGAWLLISAGLVKDRKLTSWPSLADDLRNAGARWVDEEVVVDGRWISSRKPDDIPAFNRQLLRVFALARH